ncbi:PREDICTED: uncharacterized protein LOC107103830 [Cyprinodon variegatus]|uniref:uncharacterized protein LOC107103830 n=1 Tax=Cyprinodon variegatus TaxID=28743 RepID=UPI000742C7E6|nr:PREDICTED: uncharacterized protein LOC107103830 [Cyprinodon variegatus]
MNPDLLDTGNFSLTLRKPHLSDSGNYTCTISDGRVELKLTQVQLEVKDSLTEVKVKEKAESVILPCRTKAVLNKDTLVEWTRSEPYFGFVHVFPNTSNHYRQQDDLYCARTEMNVDLLQTGDLSLTLKYPTDRDSGSYICTIYRDQDILRQRVVLHHVKEVPEVVVEPGVQSVELPCKFKDQLNCEVTEVVWVNSRGRMVHRYDRDKDPPEEQFYTYRHRTELKTDFKKTGDFSLTIKYPTDWDNKFYTCKAYREDKTILMKKRVELRVKDCQVEVQGASVQLPFQTTPELLQESRVEWSLVEPKYRTVCAVGQGCDPPGKQQTYRKGTKMNEDLLETGDLTLTMDDITEDDYGKYKCVISGKQGMILQEKTVQVRMIGGDHDQDQDQDQAQQEDFRTRSDSTDPTFLMKC